MSKLDEIKKTIQEALSDSEVYVFDPMRDGSHFQAIVVSQSFEGLSLVKQQQLVMNTLKNEFDSNAVHALGLKTFTPEIWLKKKKDYRGLTI